MANTSRRVGPRKLTEACNQQPAPSVPVRDATPRASPQQVADESRPISAVMARESDSDTNTSTRTRPSTANTTTTTATATSIGTSISTNANDARKSALLQQTPSYPPQKGQQPLPVSTSVPRSLWSLRRSRSSARSLALASTKEYVHAKLCRGPLPSPSTPGKNLFPAPQQQTKKPIDIHDPEWLASHGLKWDARGLGLVSTAV